MIEKLLNLISDSYTLKKRDISDYRSFDLNGMNISICSYSCEGLGVVSTIQGSSQMLKLDTLMIIPFEKDLHLFSYDRIHTFENDNILIELYNLLLSKDDNQEKLIKNIDNLLFEYKDIENQSHEAKWYDTILLPISINKKGNRELSNRFDKLVFDYLNEYLINSLDAKKCDVFKKKEIVKKYCENLLTDGGPSSEVFIKAKGKEFCEDLFHQAIFGV